MSALPCIQFPMALEPERGGWSSLLHLAEPVLQYADRDGAAPAPSRWECTDPSSWYYVDGVVRLRASIDVASGRAGRVGYPLTLRATALHPVGIRRCAIVLQASCAEPPYIIDREMRWRSLHGWTISSEWTPFVARWRGAHGRTIELRAIGGAPAARLMWRRGTFHMMIKLDAAALHPRWTFAGGVAVSTASPVRDTSWEASVPLLLRVIDGPESAPVAAGRFPSGSEAAFTITDHCDFDTVDAFRSFLGGGRMRAGWMGRGLRFTKGVFTIQSRATSRPAAPTLQDPEYRALVQRLHDDGSEIAPHGVNERGNIEPACFHDALARIAGAFAPRTWIDHGRSLHYCYTMGGARHADYRLLDALRAHGIDTLWAYHDAPANAVDSLNQLGLSSTDLPRVAWQIGRHVMRGDLLVAASYGRSAILERTTGRVHHVIGHAMSTARREYLRRTQSGQRSVRAAAAVPWAVLAQSRGRNGERPAPAIRWQVPFTRDDVINMVPIIYPERGVPLSQLLDDDLLLFTTMEVLHTNDAYTPGALDRLLAERGLHIAHTYLLNHLPYIAGIFVSGRGEQLSPAWLEMLGALCHVVAGGRMWNPTMGGLASWVRRSRRLTVLPLSDRLLEVSNPTAECVCNFTVLLPSTVLAADVRWDGSRPVGSRHWGDWLSVWGDVPPGRSVVVGW